MFSMLKKYKSMLNHSFWSIAALVSMNMVAQFFVYPSWSRQFGSEAYGEILYLMSFINVIAVSVGSALNLSRMASSIRSQTRNGEYNLVLLLFCLLGIPFSFLVRAISGASFQTGELPFFWLLQCVTMLRYYMDVDFRLSLDYKGYFKYYFCICVGYILGIFLCRSTGIWELALLPGEAAGVIYVLLKGQYLRHKPVLCSSPILVPLKTCAIMLATEFIANIIFNADRILLKTLIGGTAVTIYYLSSLLGKTMSLVITPLNSVIIGYLARFKGDITKKLYRNIVLAILAVSILMVLACVVGSYILIRILYPESFEMTKPFFFISSLSQVVYFATSVLTVILLRFARQEYQLYINLVYGISFVLLGIPMTMNGGIWGFSYAILLANLIRMLVSILLGLRGPSKGASLPQ